MARMHDEPLSPAKEGSMNVTFSRQGQVTVLAVEGSVDASTAETLASTLKEQIEGGNNRLVVDFAAVSYLSSAGLRALLGAVKLAREGGGDLILAAAQKDVARVLELSGFTRLLEIAADADVAVARLSAGGGG